MYLHVVKYVKGVTLDQLYDKKKNLPFVLIFAKFFFFFLVDLAPFGIKHDIGPK